MLLGIFRMAPWLVRLLETGINVITLYYGAIADGAGIEFIVTGIKALFPRVGQLNESARCGARCSAFASLLANIISIKRITRDKIAFP